MKVVFVSVVRDFKMYSRCLTDNLFCLGAEFVTYDNSTANVPIPRRYNTFLDSLKDDADSWIVLCHEDWQPLEKMSMLLKNLDKNFIYGPIGVRTVSFLSSDFIMMKGKVRQCRKDGSAARTVRGVVRKGTVDTLDCQCVIVHSSLVKRANLRFDESLGFDMYVEEFCADAFLKAGILTKTVGIKCSHYSEGTISDGFLKALEHARRKYAGSAKRFSSIVGYKTCFGGDDSRPVHRFRIRLPW